MPIEPAQRRRVRVNKLLHVYMKHRRMRIQFQIRHAKAKNRRRQQQPIAQETLGSDLSSLSGLESLSELESATEGSESLGDWDSILGDTWRSDSISSGTSMSIDDEDSDDEPMPALLPRGHRGSDSDSYSDGVSEASSEDSVSGIDGDDEEGEGESDVEDVPRRPRTVRNWVEQEIREMYSMRYERPRNQLPRGPSYLRHVLLALKAGRADHFREALRVTPLTFDKIVSKIKDDPVFSNNSNHAQISIEEQLAVALYRFGHNGNAASIQSVANWAGLGKGTVHLITRRVMTAVLRRGFMEEAVRFPTPEEKEGAKEWVERHSCKAWRHGWCLVDGTLVPLAERPHWFGESYFDRKCNYSLNIQVGSVHVILNRFPYSHFSQVVSLPNLRIIDFSYGQTGSTHDSTAWNDTVLAQNHETLMSPGEWVWADSAYPVFTFIHRLQSFTKSILC